MSRILTWRASVYECIVDLVDKGVLMRPESSSWKDIEQAIADYDEEGA